MLHNHHQDYQLLILEPQTSYRFLSCRCFWCYFSLLGWSNIWVATYALATNVYTNRLSVHSTSLYMQLWAISADGEAVHHDNSSKGNLGHLLVQAIRTQNPKIFAETFYVSFLKRYFTMLPSSDKHLAAKSRDVHINDKFWNFRPFVFVFQSCFKAEWLMNNLATRHE